MNNCLIEQKFSEVNRLQGMRVATDDAIETLVGITLVTLVVLVFSLLNTWVPMAIATGVAVIINLVLIIKYYLDLVHLDREILRKLDDLENLG